MKRNTTTLHPTQLERYKENFTMAYNFIKSRFTFSKDIATRKANLYAIEVDSNIYFNGKFNDSLCNKICKDI